MYNIIYLKFLFSWVLSDFLLLNVIYTAENSFF